MPPASLAPVSSLNIGGAEIVAYSASNAVALVVGGDAFLRLVDLSSIAAPGLIVSWALDADAQSVAVSGDLVAVAKVNPNGKDKPGTVEFFRLSGLGAQASLAPLGSVEVGALPDSIAFNNDGTKLVVANEGEPTTFFGTPSGVDPAGSISVISVNVANPSLSSVKTLGFDAAQTEELKARGVRISTGDASTDIEPEYVVVDGDVAYVTLQENNSVAVVDIAGDDASFYRIPEIRPLGLKDWSGIPLDASDKDGGFLPGMREIYGLRMADAISAFTVDGASFTITANEGDSRIRPDAINFEAPADGVYSVGLSDFGNSIDSFPDPLSGAILFVYAGAGIGGSFDFEAEKGDEFFVATSYGAVADDDYFSDEVRAGKLAGSSTNYVVVAKGEGRLKLVDDLSSEGSIYGFGGRSFTIYDERGEVVFDSGNDLEQKAYELGVYDDGRSDDKGTEPEAVKTAVVNGRVYAFVGLERATKSTTLVYDVTNPYSPIYEQALISDSSVSVEGLEFVSTESGGGGFLLVANEVSQTLDAFSFGATAEIDDLQAADNPFLLDLASTGLTNALSADVIASREADYSSQIGFYRVINQNGDVRDPVTGDVFSPGDGGYASVALAAANRVADATLSRADDQSASESVVFGGIGGGLVAMYGSVANTGHTFFSFADANADGYNHFRYLEPNKVGFEDVFGGGDRDHNDLIVQLNFG